MIRAFLFAAALTLSCTAYAAEDIDIFNGQDLQGWKEKSFVGHTQYRLADSNINASCDQSASSLYREIEIDLDKTPILTWSWRVENAEGFPADERIKKGDDFAARIYAVRDGGFILPDILSLNYVWARDENIGADWPNPFYGKARMVVLDNAAQDGEWQTHSRNLKDDFKTYFGEDIDTIDGISIMTDCDNAGGRAITQYGRITMTD